MEGGRKDGRSLSDAWATDLQSMRGWRKERNKRCTWHASWLHRPAVQLDGRRLTGRGAGPVPAHGFSPDLPLEGASVTVPRGGSIVHRGSCRQQVVRVRFGKFDAEAHVLQVTHHLLHLSEQDVLVPMPDNDVFQVGKNRDVQGAETVERLLKNLCKNKQDEIQAEWEGTKK